MIRKVFESCESLYLLRFPLNNVYYKSIELQQQQPAKFDYKYFSDLVRYGRILSNYS